MKSERVKTYVPGVAEVCRGFDNTFVPPSLRAAVDTARAQLR